MKRRNCFGPPLALQSFDLVLSHFLAEPGGIFFRSPHLAVTFNRIAKSTDSFWFHFAIVIDRFVLNIEMMKSSINLHGRAWFAFAAFAHVWMLLLHCYQCDPTRGYNSNRIVFPSNDVASGPNRQPALRSSTVLDYIDANRDVNVTNVKQFLGAFGLNLEHLEEAGPVIARRSMPNIPMQANCQVEMRTIDLDTGKHTINRRH